MNTLSAENEMEFRKSIQVRFEGRTMPRKNSKDVPD